MSILAPFQAQSGFPASLSRLSKRLFPEEQMMTITPENTAVFLSSYILGLMCAAERLYLAGSAALDSGESSTWTKCHAKEREVYARIGYLLSMRAGVKAFS